MFQHNEKNVFLMWFSVANFTWFLGCRYGALSVVIFHWISFFSLSKMNEWSLEYSWEFQQGWCRKGKPTSACFKSDGLGWLSHRLCVCENSAKWIASDSYVSEAVGLDIHSPCVAITSHSHHHNIFLEQNVLHFPNRICHYVRWVCGQLCKPG